MGRNEISVLRAAFALTITVAAVMAACMPSAPAPPDTAGDPPPATPAEPDPKPELPDKPEEPPKQEPDQPPQEDAEGEEGDKGDEPQEEEPAPSSPDPEQPQDPAAPPQVVTQDTAPEWLRIAGQGSIRIEVAQRKDGFVEYELTPISAAGSEFAYWDGVLTSTAVPRSHGIGGGEAAVLEALFVPDLYHRIPGTTLGVFHQDAGRVNAAAVADVYAEALRAAPPPLAARVLGSEEVVKGVFTQITLSGLVPAELNGFNFVQDGRIYLREGADATTMIHESAHVFEGVGLSDAQRARLLNLYSADVQRLTEAMGCDPRQDPTEFNGQCGGYQYANASEYFAVLTSAYSGFADGDIGRGDAPARQELRERYPDAFRFLGEVYG